MSSSSLLSFISKSPVDNSLLIQERISITVRVTGEGIDEKSYIEAGIILCMDKGSHVLDVTALKIG